MDIQLFQDNEFSERFDDWTATVKDAQLRELFEFNDTISISKTFGQFIWDNNLSDLAEYFSRDYFSDNFTAIIGALEIAGTFEGYLKIIQSALGAGTSVVFDTPDPSHLIINITNPTGDNVLVGKQGNELHEIIPDQTQYPDNVLTLKKSTTPLTFSETQKMIELLNVNGVFVEINFVT